MRYIALLFAFGASVVHATEYECNYSGSQREMNQCAIHNYLVANELMNKSYFLALQKAHPDLLIHTQQKWINARDNKCAKMKDQPGENETIDYLTCLQVETEKRTLEILQH
jgi:uncharacterized protein YecT (DUF1311 family)